MSFKYRFILSFVLLEIFFITLIVSVNFVAISDLSNKLTKDNMDSKISFLSDLVKVPLTIYDLATLDNILEKTQENNLINSVIILDNNSTILSKNYNFEKIDFEEFLKIKQNTTYKTEDEVYEIKYFDIEEENNKLGSMYLVFDISENNRFIKNNKNKTLMIIFIEILISTILSYLIGSRLTNTLVKLSSIALKIGEDKNPKIPFTETKGEIGILSRSLKQMKDDLNYRTKKLKDLTKKLKKQKKELEVASKTKDDFLANMSHELKTPLNSINVISSVMMKNKKETLNEKDLENIRIINRSGNDLLLLINDVLDLSKLEAGEICINNDNVNVHKLLNDVYKDFKMQTQLKGLDFNLQINKAVDYAFTDKVRLKQILKNLLSNSLKFTSKGHISINVFIKNDDIVIEIKDTGIGISKEKLEHIFDRFKQVDGSTTRKYGGTGLGLSISKQLANLLGGDIKVKSIEGVGSTFTASILRNKELIDYKMLNNLLLAKKQHDKEIIIFNNDPLSFIHLSIELKKSFKLTNTSNFKEFESNINKNNFNKYIVDISHLEEEQINTLSKYKEKIIAIYDDSMKNKEESIKLFSISFSKPFNINDILKNIC